VSRIIINNDTDLTDLRALFLIAKVVEMGKISNDEKQYCYVTRFDGEIYVATDLLKNGHSFRIWKE